MKNLFYSDSVHPVMSDRPSFMKQAENHLQEALDADESAMKDYHIRSALQVCVFDETGITAGHSESN
jgi:hypothetical protein